MDLSLRPQCQADKFINFELNMAAKSFLFGLGIFKPTDEMTLSIYDEVIIAIVFYCQYYNRINYMIL